MRLNSNLGPCRRCNKIVEVRVTIWTYIGWYCYDCRENEWKILGTPVGPIDKDGNQKVIAHYMGM